MLGCGGGLPQLHYLGLELGGRMCGQLFLGFAQRDLSHARLDLQPLLLVAQARFLRLGLCHCGGGRCICLCGLGACGFLRTCFALGFFLLLGLAQAFLAELEALS